MSLKQKGKSKKKTSGIIDEVKAENSPDFKYPWAQIRQLFWEKSPLFTISALSSIVTYLVQHKGGAVTSLDAYPLHVRFANAFVSYVAYLWKMIWPQNLAVFYPHPDLWQQWQVAGAVLIFIAITFLIIRAAKSLPYLIVGWLWYMGTLVPVIGIVQVGDQAMADRYTYISMIGLFIMTAWIIPELLKRWRYREKALIASSTLLIACYSMITWTQVGYWHSSFTLFDHALNVTVNNSVAYYNIGNAFSRLGNPKQAILNYDKAIEIDPHAADFYVNRGLSYAALGDQTRAIIDYDKAININPNNLVAYSNRGTAYAAIGDHNLAIVNYDRAIAIDPEIAEVYFNRGDSYVALGDLKRAIAEYDRAIGVNPKYASAYSNRGVVYKNLGDFRQAIADFVRAIDINSEFAEAYCNRGNAYAAIGDQRQAIADYDKAITINPKYATAYYNRGNAYATLNNKYQAGVDYDRAIEIDPKLAALAYR